MGLLVRPAEWTSWTDQLNRPAGQTRCTDQLNRPAERTSWSDQLDVPAGQNSWTDQFFFLKTWPVCIFEDFPFSLYIVAASESDEALVFLILPSSSWSLFSEIDLIPSSYICSSKTINYDLSVARLSLVSFYWIYNIQYLLC